MHRPDGMPGPRRGALSISAPVMARWGMAAAITRLIGVYDADGSVLGELSYFVAARFGRAHCALCDITHGRVRERADWRASRDRLPVPVTMYHRDDQPDHVRAVVGTALPVLVAETAGGDVVVVADRGQLDGCDGSPERLVEHVESSLAALDLAWPPATA